MLNGSQWPLVVLGSSQSFYGNLRPQRVQYNLLGVRLMEAGVTPGSTLVATLAPTARKLVGPAGIEPATLSFEG